MFKSPMLVSKQNEKHETIIQAGNAVIGGDRLAVMAGPCSVEDNDGFFQTAKAVKAAGAQFLRGGAFKPRTSPYSFQGLAEKGLELLAEAREQTGLSIVTEVMDPESVELVASYADVLQIGARNMQNYSLLKKAGQQKKPVLLKRGLSATMEEWLLAAEYILNEGNPNVILCERGIRTFETYTRNTLDLSAVAVAKQLTHLPVIADPSHGVGHRKYIGPMALAAIAAGADGVMLEIHSRPDEALSDGDQSLSHDEWNAISRQLFQMDAFVREMNLSAVR